MANRHPRSSHGRILLPVAVLLAPTLSACADPKPGKMVTHENVCQADNDQQRVTISGYLTSAGMMTLCSHGTCSLKLRKDKDATEPAITVGIKPGSGKNRMADLPEKFGKDDLKFTTNEGKELGNLAHVRVTGKALAGEGCQILNVDLIETVE